MHTAMNVMETYQGDLLLVSVNFDEKENELMFDIKRYVNYQIITSKNSVLEK